MDEKKTNESADSCSEKEGNAQASTAKDVPKTNSEDPHNTSGNLSPNAAFFFQGLSASPPSFVSMDQIMKAAEDISKSSFNMALAHEIAVNKDFQIQKVAPESGYGKKIKDMLHKAFWDILEEQLSQDPPNFTQAMVLLNEIKEGLLELLLPYHTRIKNEINEILDIDLIQQQAQNNALDILSYANFIILTMSRLCAPVRDTKIQELKQLTNIIPLYRCILETLDLMKLDMTNFTIQQYRPHIQQHSIEYEKKKFKEILESLEGLSPSVDGLEFTRKWLNKVYDDLANVSNEEPSCAPVQRKAYLEVLCWEDDEIFPETLHLDHERFLKLRDNLTVMILTASVILVTYSTVGPSIQGISDFKEELKNHVQIILEDAPQCNPKALEAKMEVLGQQVVKEVNECLDKHGYTLLEKENEEMLISQIKNIASPDHSVKKLLRKRIIEFLELVLSTPTTVQIPPGLSTFQTQLSGFAGQFVTLVKHNQAVFCDYYDEIIKEHSKEN